MAAYVFSKKKFKIKGALWEINQMALMFVATAVGIPRYLIIVNLGAYNTWFAHILPLIAMPVGLFLVKQFVRYCNLEKSYHSSYQAGAGNFRCSYIPAGMGQRGNIKQLYNKRSIKNINILREFHWC